MSIVTSSVAGSAHGLFGVTVNLNVAWPAAMSASEGVYIGLAIPGSDKVPETAPTASQDMVPPDVVPAN